MHTSETVLHEAKCHRITYGACAAFRSTGWPLHQTATVEHSQVVSLRHACINAVIHFRHHAGTQSLQPLAMPSRHRHRNRACHAQAVMPSDPNPVLKCQQTTRDNRDATTRDNRDVYSAQSFICPGGAPEVPAAPSHRVGPALRPLEAHRTAARAAPRARACCRPTAPIHPVVHRVARA